MHSHASIRVGPLTNIPKLLSSLGYKPEPIIEAAGFDMNEFEDPDNRIPFLAGSHLLAMCVKVTGCQNFGFLLGQHAEPSHLGIAGFLLRNALDVKSALNSLAKFLTLHDQGGIVTINTNEDTVHFGYVITEDNVEATDQIYDMSIVLACKIMRALCGEKWNPEQVRLRRNEPKDLMPYKLFFQAPIHFNPCESNLVFNKSWLDYCIPSADPLLQHHLLKEAEQLHIKQSKHFVSILQKLLYQCLVNQQCSAAKMANQLGIHERTLHRHLNHHGTTFRRELEWCATH